MNTELLLACLELYRVEKDDRVRDHLRQGLTETLQAQEEARELDQRLQSFVVSRLKSLLKEGGTQ